MALKTHGKANTAGTKGYEQSSSSQTIRYNKIARPISKLHPHVHFLILGDMCVFQQRSNGYREISFCTQNFLKF
ncbi:hypothetical protein BpHYR1_047889 [Brachionus plicatilis]|uniref:Uncharacterized protein n=1 Tax=Brachionus plicatilis TaxID=10195 RepID=A0A3M7T8P2_BRAPC|nr:hypothetical protein BpHYR1_047889 [Brachionus plicatilis]